jgi:hypothetical protein
VWGCGGGLGARTGRQKALPVPPPPSPTIPPRQLAPNPTTPTSPALQMMLHFKSEECTKLKVEAEALRAAQRRTTATSPLSRAAAAGSALIAGGAGGPQAGDGNKAGAAISGSLRKAAAAAPRPPPKPRAPRTPSLKVPTPPHAVQLEPPRLPRTTVSRCPYLHPHPSRVPHARCADHSGVP